MMNSEEERRPDPDELEETMVIADMSGLPPRRPMLFPSFDAGRQKVPERPDDPPQPVDVDAEGIKAAMKGAIGASLLLWLVYAAVFGAFIFVLTRLFRLL
ncbi:MAG: hypothetical protein II474_07670 [Firmicutes bacterium]|nr:hypothetical protein [Bacillota bacterium]